MVVTLGDLFGPYATWVFPLRRDGDAYVVPCMHQLMRLEEVVYRAESARSWCGGVV